MMALVRNWIGSSIFALLGVGLGLWSVRNDLSGWVVGAIIVLTLAGGILCWPVHAEPEPERVTFKGDVRGSTVIGAYSEADTFVEGDVRESLFMNVVHRPKRRR